MISDEYGLDVYPWEKTEAETSGNYAAFIVYRDLGVRRTLRNAALTYYGMGDEDFVLNKGKIVLIARWSSKFKWVRRCEEYDTWMQKVSDANDIQVVKEMRIRHARISTLAQGKVVEYLSGLKPSDVAKMSIESAMRVFDLAVKNERLARGIPDSITALTDANGEALAIRAVTDEMLERKLSAWMQVTDERNELEAGEPPGPPELPPTSPGQWPSGTDTMPEDIV